ncbi:hypothetical protein D3C81_1788840 [compost metagenome]
MGQFRAAGRGELDVERAIARTAGLGVGFAGDQDFFDSAHGKNPPSVIAKIKINALLNCARCMCRGDRADLSLSLKRNVTA